jgi:hypothetical protein
LFDSIFGLFQFARRRDIGRSDRRYCERRRDLIDALSGCGAGRKRSNHSMNAEE